MRTFSMIVAILTTCVMTSCRTSSDHPSGMFAWRVAPGIFEVKSKKSGDSGGVLSQLEFEAGGVFGGGLRVGGYRSEDNVIGRDSSVTSGYLFPHVTFRMASDRFRMPFRIGPSLEHHAASDESFSGIGSTLDYDYTATGVGVELAPELDLYREPRSAMSVYGRLHGGFGGAVVDGGADGNAEMLDLEAGLRWTNRKLLLQTGVMHRNTDYTRLGSANAEFSFTGLILSVGIRW